MSPLPLPPSKLQVQLAQDVLLKQCRVVVVSRGAKGCVARGSDGSVGVSPACSVEVCGRGVLPGEAAR